MTDSRRIVISGVSKGLGRAMLGGFVQRGHVVCGCSRNEQDVRRLNDEFGPACSFSVVDVRHDEEVAGWAEEVIGSGGPPELLINNAALINENAVLWEVPPEEFSRVIDVNIKGTYHVVRHFVPAMIEAGRGVIVNFSSTWGRVTSPEVAPYCATKFAVEGLTRALADELPAGMAAVPLNPGVINTDMLQSCFGEAAAGYPSPEKWAKKAVPFLLGLGRAENGKPVTVPGG